MQEKLEGSACKDESCQVIDSRERIWDVKNKGFEFCEDYTTTVMTIVKQIILSGETFLDQWGCRKNNVSVLDKFE